MRSFKYPLSRFLKIKPLIMTLSQLAAWKMTRGPRSRWRRLTRACQKYGEREGLRDSLPSSSRSRLSHNSLRVRSEDLITFLWTPGKWGNNERGVFGPWRAPTRVLQTRLVFIIGYLALAEDRKGNLTSFKPRKEKKRKQKQENEDRFPFTRSGQAFTLPAIIIYLLILISRQLEKLTNIYPGS